MSTSVNGSVAPVHWIIFLHEILFSLEAQFFYDGHITYLIVAT